MREGGNLLPRGMGKLGESGGNYCINERKRWDCFRKYPEMWSHTINCRGYEKIPDHNQLIIMTSFMAFYAALK